MTQSQWSGNLLNVELNDVHFRTNDMVGAWSDGLGIRCLLRANLYIDAKANLDSKEFGFNSEKTTGMEVIKSFIDAFPEYTYTQDTNTGVLWLHRKNIKYNDILNQKIEIIHAVSQVRMYSEVFLPLCRLLAPQIHRLEWAFSSPMANTFDYCIDLPSGVYSFRDILNYCCSPDVTKCFLIRPGMANQLTILPVNFSTFNPLAPPRAVAVQFWEVEVGTITNAYPTLDDVRNALSDPNPKKRIAARFYLKATDVNYSEKDLVEKSDDPKKVIWAVLGLKSIHCLADGNQPYLCRNGRVMQIFTNNLAQIDPGLALLTSMELTREKQDASFMDVVVGRKFSADEIAVIKPDVIRIARQSKLVRDKLLSIKFNDPDLSPEGLRKLEITNLFTLVPAGNK